MQVIDENDSDRQGSMDDMPGIKENEEQKYEEDPPRSPLVSMNRG